MKLIQKYPLNWFSLYTYELTDSAVIQSYKSIWGEWERPIPLKDISPLTGQSTFGNKALDNIAWVLFGIAFMLYILHVLKTLSVVLFLTGVACFAVRLIWQETYTVFNNAFSHESLFLIRRTRKGKEAT